nr:hypothetical protein [Ferrimicrobium acidiphilum]
MLGAIRRRTVPAELRGRGFSRDKIYEWARRELSGEEPAAIPKAELNGIKEGTTTELVIRPRKPGFFGPDGRFIEAYDHAPGFGDDLEESDRRWGIEEASRKWADEENDRFSRSTAPRGVGFGRFLWEHGRRIEEYAKESGLSAASLLRLLDTRKTASGYRRHTHQTCLDLYRWKPHLELESPILDWSWERVDAVLRFSNRNEVRDAVERLLCSRESSPLSDSEVTRLLDVKGRGRSATESAEIVATFETVRARLRNLEEIGPELTRQAFTLLTSRRQFGNEQAP